MREQAGGLGRGSARAWPNGEGGDNDEEWGADEERESSGSRKRAEA